MNILIADSGSTKTEWILMTQTGEKKYFYTGGLNPYFLSQDEMIGVIEKELKSQIDTPINEIHFYGAGCGRSTSREMVGKALSTCFHSAEIFVESDLLAAAKACFGNQPGVACILGTGSNSCLYDGKNVEESIPSLGFVLGDEGSGGYFGKQILHSYFYKVMPEDLRIAMEQRYDMRLDQILLKVYKKPQANRFVASFAEMLGDFPKHPFVQEMVKKGFEDFADNQLGFFKRIGNREIGFVGSIAYIYKGILKQVLADRGLKLGVIVRKPIERLAEYHLQEIS